MQGTEKIGFANAIMIAESDEAERERGLMEATRIYTYDSTLRDGEQCEGITLSLADKLAIVRRLDEFGIDYIEGGFPASNPKDVAFFREVAAMELRHAQIAAFGSTCKKGVAADDDAGLADLLACGAPVVTIVGKTWDAQVERALQTTLEENLRMIADSVAYLKAAGRRVVFDAEHYFDGYKANADYALACVGAAVEAGASQVQGTYIGFGERCGNTNLSTIIPNLQMKKGYRCIPEDKLVRLGKTARYIAQVTNLVLSPNMPYVGRSAFAHKGGMHVDGVAKNTLSFEHITPESVGNRRQILLSEFAGRTAIAGKIAALDSSITRDSQVTAELIEKLKGLEYQGFAFESAAASFELFALKQLGKYRPAFDLEYFKTLGEQPAVNVERCCSAIVKVRVGESIEMTSAEGDGPVHALDIALRKALEVFYPCLSQVRLIDYKVRVMEGHRATAAIVRVLIESTDGVSTWTTVGCSADIIDASWQALRDSMEYKLMKDGAVSGPVA